MIRFQVVERQGSNLYKILIDAMKTGELRTFSVTKRGRKVSHINESYPGWINWSHNEGVITCEVLSPRKPGQEWRLLHAFIGRLADKYPAKIHCITIQFQDNVPSKDRKSK